jgi:hypothetical protein
MNLVSSHAQAQVSISIPLESTGVIFRGNVYKIKYLYLIRKNLKTVKRLLYDRPSGTEPISGNSFSYYVCMAKTII